MKKLAIVLVVAALAWVVWTGYVTAPLTARVHEPSKEPPSTLTPAPEPVQSEPQPALEGNLLGRFPVFMYHRIGDANAEWARSRDSFRKDLSELNARGYTLVNLSDFLEGKAVVPAGRSPAVLTFDDSTQGQFNYLVKDNGEVVVDPDCAVGIILEASKLYPELGVGGTFFINANPFGQRAYWQQKLRHLVELGFEIGNHTYTHPKLRDLPSEKVMEELARLQQHVEDAVPGYRLRALALPFGIAPVERQLALAGKWGDVTYNHSFILEVGAEPAFSPLSERYNPASIPRINTTDELFYRWLNWLDADPVRKFVSNGKPLGR